MKHSSDNVFLNFLQPNYNPELDLIAAAVDVMASNLQAIHGEAGNVFLSLAHNMRQRLQAARQLPFKAYFTGDGPRARRLKETLAATDWLNGIDAHFFDFRMAQLVKKFSCDLIETEEALEAMQSFVNSLNPLIYQVPAEVYISEYAPPIVKVVDMTTGLYLKEEDGKHPVQILILRGTLRHSGIEVLLTAFSTMPPVLYYYHPLEEAWVTCDMTALLPGTRELLIRELKEALRKNDAGYRMRDWPAELVALKEKAHRVFADDYLLPEQHPPFYRDAVNKDGSVIRFFDAGYQMTFIATKGKYPSEAVTISQNIGTMQTSLPLDKISETAKRRLFRCADYFLDSLLQKINEIKVQAASQAPTSSLPS